MINNILKAVMKECSLFLADKGGTVLLKTDFEPSRIQSYSMPLILVDILDAPDSCQYIGGISRIDWNFAFNSYNHMPNATVEDDGGYSIDLLFFIDEIRRHFSKGIWLSSEMTLIEQDYCFKFVLSGLLSADALNQDGIVMGYKIVFDSCAIDGATDFTEKSIHPLSQVVQVGNPPFD